MLVEQKKMKRQSQILLQSVSTNEALQKALGEVAKLSHTLESQALQHQQQVRLLHQPITALCHQARLNSREGLMLF